MEEEISGKKREKRERERERDRGKRERKRKIFLFEFLGFRVFKIRIYTLCDFSKQSFIFTYFKSYFRYLTITT